MKFSHWLREKELNEAKIAKEELNILSKYFFTEKTKALKNYLKDKNSDKIKKLKDFVKVSLKEENIKDINAVSYLLLNNIMNGSDVVGKKYRQTKYSRKLTFEEINDSFNNKDKMENWKELMKDWFSSVKPSTLERWGLCIKELDALNSINL